MDKATIRNETGRCRMGKRVVASYCSSFLKSEMLHIYRQVKALRGVDTFVVTKEVQNAERFPFDNIEIIPKRRTNLLVHGWLKFVERRPPIVYRGEYQTLDSLLERHGADLMHIYFGHTGVHLLPFIEQWESRAWYHFTAPTWRVSPRSRIMQGNCAVFLMRSRSCSRV